MNIENLHYSQKDINSADFKVKVLGLGEKAKLDLAVLKEEYQDHADYMLMGCKS